jgi:hypothetical protein
MLAHSRDEHVDVAQIAECEAKLEAWLTGEHRAAGAGPNAAQC